MFIPTPSDIFPGFYLIPGFNDYVISQSGEVLNIRNQSFLKGSINPAGYFNYRLRSDDGHIHTWGRHRLLCRVFKYPGPEFDELDVNHINGIKGDDRLDNLEVISRRENIHHAGSTGLSPKCCPISVRDVDTGNIQYFPSIVECARAFGMSKDAISYRVCSGEEIIFPERKQYRQSHSDKPWYIPRDIEKEMLKYGRSKTILVRHLLSKKIVEFSKLKDLASYLDVSPSTITSWMSQPNQPVLPGLVQLKYGHDLTPWREVSDPYREYVETQKATLVKVTHDESQESRIYLSAIECARDRGIKPTALAYRLKTKGSQIFSDGCRYEYYPH